MGQASVNANGLEFTYLEDGPSDGPLALCLHGFPDTAHTWRFLLPVLAEHGYHAVAPFMRGYAPTDVPADGRYQVGALAKDANSLHEALGGGADAVIIGHDWGAMATYGAAGFEPDRWRRVVTAAVPPAQSVMQAWLSYEQLHRSWYMFFFQTFLADIAVPADDYRFIDRLWEDWSPGYDGKKDAALVKEAIGTAERTAAAIGYYRALLAGDQHDPALAGEQAAALGVPPQPTLYLHGDQDNCFSLDAFDDPLPLMSKGSEVAIVKGAGHFLQLEQPDTVNELIVNFLAL